MRVIFWSCQTNFYFCKINQKFLNLQIGMQGKKRKAFTNRNA